MKEFTIHTKSTDYIHIKCFQYIVENLDENSVFQKLSLIFRGSECTFIEIDYKQMDLLEEEALRRPFKLIGVFEGKGTNKVFISSLYINLTMVEQFLLTVNKMEPLPFQVIEDLIKRGINLSSISINPLASAHNVDGAIQLALEACKLGYFEKFTELANFYLEKEQMNNWMNLLKAMPKNHPSYIVAQAQLLNHYNSIEDFSLEMLMNRFEAAYNARLSPERERYFAEIAQEEDLDNLIDLDDGESNSSLLVKLALKLRQKNHLIQQHEKSIDNLKKGNSTLEEDRSASSHYKPRIF
jgi:hypothetical protein